jgi:hypothetical protein
VVAMIVFMDTVAIVIAIFSVFGLGSGLVSMLYVSSR